MATDVLPARRALLVGADQIDGFRLRGGLYLVTPEMARSTRSPTGGAWPRRSTERGQCPTPTPVLGWAPGFSGQPTGGAGPVARWDMLRITVSYGTIRRSCLAPGPAVAAYRPIPKRPPETPPIARPMAYWFDVLRVLLGDQAAGDATPTSSPRIMAGRAILFVRSVGIG